MNKSLSCITTTTDQWLFRISTRSSLVGPLPASRHSHRVMLDSRLSTRVHRLGVIACPASASVKTRVTCPGICLRSSPPPRWPASHPIVTQASLSVLMTLLRALGRPSSTSLLRLSRRRTVRLLDCRKMRIVKSRKRTPMQKTHLMYVKYLKFVPMNLAWLSFWTPQLGTRQDSANRRYEALNSVKDLIEGSLSDSEYAIACLEDLSLSFLAQLVDATPGGDSPSHKGKVEILLANRKGKGNNTNSQLVDPLIPA